MSRHNSLGDDTCDDCVHSWDDHGPDAGGVGWRCTAWIKERGHRCTCTATPPYARKPWESDDE